MKNSALAVTIGLWCRGVRRTLIERIEGRFGRVLAAEAFGKLPEGGFHRSETPNNRVELLVHRPDLAAERLGLVLREAQRFFERLESGFRVLVGLGHRCVPHLLAGSLMLALSAEALGDDSTAATDRLTLRGFSLAQQPSSSPSQAANDSEFDADRFQLEFGDPEPLWVSLGGSISAYSEGTDLEGTIELTKFIVPRRLEVGGAVSGWRFLQPGDDAFGASAGMVIRWHFMVRDRWSLYIDGGLSLLVTSDLVPDRGTGFNFMPKLGLGGTWQPTDEPWRLFASLRWHHISNARIGGEVANPSRDQPLLHVGVEFPL